MSDRLQRAWPGVRPGQPQPLGGGFWASMHRVPLTGQPPGIPDEVVVRFAPHRAMGAKESAVQRAVADQGFPTPQVRLSGPDPQRDGWWSVMDFCPGSPLLAGLDGTAALRRAPALVREMPARLAETMAAVHRLDPEPVTAAVLGSAPEVAWSTIEVLDRLRSGAVAANRSDVVAALERLEVGAVPSHEAVVCHGDLHPLNVLDRDGELVVLDWTGAARADPSFDVAFTELLLANPPLELPGPLAPIGRAAGRLLARRFVAAYRCANPRVSLGQLGWFRALHSARMLIELTHHRAGCGPRVSGHPFEAVAPAAAEHLMTATGVDVSG